MNFVDNTYLELSKCLNLLIRMILLNDNITSIFLIDTNLEIDMPTTRYSSNSTSTAIYMDKKPDVYISDLTFEAFDWLMKERTTRSMFNPNATYIMISSGETEHPFAARTSDSIRYYSMFSEVTIVEDGICIGMNLSHFPNPEVTKVKLLRIPEKPNATICLYRFWPPYAICTDCQKNKGINIEVMEFFLRFNNITPIIYRCHSNDTCNTHCERVLRTGLCDVCFKSTIREDTLGDYILYVTDEYDYWYIPNSERVPNWYYMFISLPYGVWGIWIVITVILSVFSWYIAKIENKIRKKTVKTYPYSIAKIIVKDFLELSEKINVEGFSNLVLFSVIFFSSCILNVTYKAKFTYLLQGPNFLPQKITSIYDAVDRNFSVIYTPHLKVDLEYRYPEIKSFFTSNFIDAQEEDWYHLVTKRKDVITLKAQSAVKFIGDKLLDENGRSIIDVLPKPAKRSIFGYVFLRNHPLFSRMSLFVIRLRDHGFLQNIISKYDRQYAGYEVWRAESYERRKLNFTDLQGPVLIFCFGNVCAVIMLLYELYK